MMKHYLLKLIDISKDKLIFLFSTISIFLAPVAELLIVAVSLAVFDMIIAILLSVKLKGVKSFESAKTESTFYKIILYCAIIILLHIVDLLFLKKQGISLIKMFTDNEKLINFVTNAELASAGIFIIIVRESRSIDEKWEQYFGWSYYDTTINIINKIKEFFPSKLKIKKDGTALQPDTNNSQNT